MRTLLFIFCLIGMPASAPADDPDADTIDPEANARVQKAIEQRSDVVEQPKRSRLICRRETPIGSHRRIKICRSIAQIEDDRDHAERYVRELEATSVNLALPPSPN